MVPHAQPCDLEARGRRAHQHEPCDPRHHQHQRVLPFAGDAVSLPADGGDATSRWQTQLQWLREMGFVEVDYH